MQQVQRSLLGQVVTSRPCPVCRGFGEVIPDPCRQCNGDGRVRARRTVRANIPAGVGDGIRVRLAGQGEVGPGGGAPGDLYVEVQELPHERFTRDGIDLHCTVHVPMTAAALGTSMGLQTLHGVEDLDIQPGTQSGTVITMRGQGMPRLRGTGIGNLHVHIEVVTPTKVDGRQAELLRELADPARRGAARTRGPRHTAASSPGSATRSPVGDRGGPRPVHRSSSSTAARRPGPFVLGGAEGRHAATVRRLRVGRAAGADRRRRRLGAGDGDARPAAARSTSRSRPAAQDPPPRSGSRWCRRCPRVSGASWPSSSPPRPAWTPSCRGPPSAASPGGRRTGPARVRPGGGRPPLQAAKQSRRAVVPPCGRLAGTTDGRRSDRRRGRRAGAARVGDRAAAGAPTARRR